MPVDEGHNCVVNTRSLARCAAAFQAIPLLYANRGSELPADATTTTPSSIMKQSMLLAFVLAAARPAARVTHNQPFGLLRED